MVSYMHFLFVTSAFPGYRSFFSDRTEFEQSGHVMLFAAEKGDLVAARKVRLEQKSYPLL